MKGRDADMREILLELPTSRAHWPTHQGAWEHYLSGVL